MSAKKLIIDNDGQGPSAGVWYDCPWEELRNDPNRGIAFFDDFMDLPLAPTLTTQIGFGKYKAFADTGGTIKGVPTVNSVERVKSVLEMGADTADDAVAIAQAQPHFLISGSPASSGKLWFEASVAMSSILINTIGWFVGLAETDLLTLANDVPFADGNTISNAGSFLGFRKEEDGLGVIDTVYSDRATSFTNVGDAATSVAANTFIRLGLRYDPEDVAKCIRFFANGTELDDGVSRSTLTGLTNLDANALGLIFALIVDSAGTSAKAYMNWWRCAQMYVR